MDKKTMEKMQGMAQGAKKMGMSVDAIRKMALKMGMPESAIPAFNKAMGIEEPAAKESAPAAPAARRGGMDGREILGRLKKLSQIESIKDVPQLTRALFPGTHCPLMGAEMAAAGIKDCLLVIVGTDECSYYTKGMTINENWGGIGGRCVSVVLDSHDVTFGSTKSMHDAFKEIMAEYAPKCVILVTTCVIEVIGDDYDAIAAELQKQYGIPVLAVHTEHFKCEDHFPGLERTISACLSLMEPPAAKSRRVNVLGQRMGRFDETELYALLTASGVEIGLQLPSGCTVADISRAAEAQVNVVVHNIALPLAEAMQEKFGVPYVYFNKFLGPERIRSTYEELYKYLGLPLPEAVAAKYGECKELERALADKLAGVPYIYGNTPFDCFEFNAYLASLKMEPQLIQSNRFGSESGADIETILQHCDPYICKAANIAPLRYVYDELHPWLYFGHEFADVLRRKGIADVHCDRAGSMMGFECNLFMLKNLESCVEQAKEYRKEAGL